MWWCTSIILAFKEAEAGGLLEVQGQSGLHVENLSQKKKIQVQEVSVGKKDFIGRKIICVRLAENLPTV